MFYDDTNTMYQIFYLNSPFPRLRLAAVFKPIMLFVILGFQVGLAEVFALLRCNAALIDGYRRFGIACRTLGGGTCRLPKRR